MRRSICTAAALVAAAAALPAQTPRAIPEVRPFVGAYVPTGDLRDQFKTGAMFGVQTAFELEPGLHLLGTFGWVPGQTKYAVDDDGVNIFAYDVGLELGAVRSWGYAWQVKPFVGVGAGGRTYAYKADALADRTCTAGYGALGSELQTGKVAVRLEARDNVVCFKSPLAGAKARTRNDVGLGLGVAFHFR